MGQPEDSQRSRFQRVKYRSEQFAELRKAIHNVIEAGKDPRMLNYLHGLVGKQGANLVPGIYPDVWRETVAKAIRQIIDQRRVAEMIHAAPVMPMCFKGVPAVRAEQD